jgi:D-arginine dehydrogenase
MRNTRFVVIGAGFAGAATACFLARNGAENVTIVEREKMPGVHASGRNAAMVRQVVPEPDIAAMAHEGCEFIRDWALRTSDSHFRRTGSMLLCGAEETKAFENHYYHSENFADAEVLTRRHATMSIHLLRNAEFENCVSCRSDGVADISALLEHYLAEAGNHGARLILRSGVSGIEVEDGTVRAVQAGKLTIPCDVLINASGAWAAQIGAMAGAMKIPMLCYKRHLLCSRPMKNVSADWPFVWDIQHGIYFRPESAGLLLSPCDQVEYEPCLPRFDDEAIDLLAAKLQLHIPELSSISIANGWSGLRTLTNDNRFVIGWDKAIRGFFWVAGLGGHGVTCSAAIGRLAADVLLDRTQCPPAFDPARFCAQEAPCRN